MGVHNPLKCNNMIPCIEYTSNFEFKKIEILLSLVICISEKNDDVIKKFNKFLW